MRDAWELDIEREFSDEDLELELAGASDDPDADFDELDPAININRGQKLIQRIDQATFTPVQALVWTDTESRVRLYLGGIGAGKTYASCVDLVNMPANTTALVLAPTFPQLRDSYLALFLHLYEQAGIIQKFNKSEMEMELKGNRKILFRSAEHPDRLRGSNVGLLYFDEAAFASEESYQVAIGRVRRQPGRILITTSPNGKANWVYRLAISGHASVYRAPTASNQFLPSFYTDMLTQNYGGAASDRARQELGAEFVDVAGALFSRTWFTEFVGDLPQRMIMCRAWDTAATVNKRADYTVGLLCGLVPGSSRMILIDCIAGKWSGDNVDELILKTAQADRERWGDVTTVIEREPGSAGKRLVDMQLRMLAGYRVKWFTSGSSKLARAVPVARAAGQGLITYVPGPWTDAFFNEIEQFTGATGVNAEEHDDHIDALSLAFTSLVGSVKRVAAY